MKEFLTSAGFLALVGTIFGGAGLKLIDVWLGGRKDRRDEENKAKSDLRAEIEDLRREIDKAKVEEQRLEALVDTWRERYYDLRDEKQKVVTELTIVLERLRAFEKQQHGDDTS